MDGSIISTGDAFRDGLTFCHNKDIGDLLKGNMRSGEVKFIFINLYIDFQFSCELIRFAQYV